MKKLIPIVLCALVLVPGCGNMSNLAKDSLIGGGAGAAVGAAVGALIGKDAKGALIGAAIGTAVGGGTGAIIGKKMDKKAAELAALEDAKVEKVYDANGLEGLKVTFSSGILFKTNKADLSAASKKELAEFANKMSDLKDTDITIYGHTDNTGSAAVNEKLSAERAASVAAYLKSCGIAGDRLKTQGLSYTDPVADNSTVEGRALNRRVEIYITADENMIAAAQNGTLE